MITQFDIAAGALILLAEHDLDTITGEDVVAAVTNAAPPDTPLEAIKLAIALVLQTKAGLLTPQQNFS